MDAVTVLLFVIVIVFVVTIVVLLSWKSGNGGGIHAENLKAGRDIHISQGTQTITHHHDNSTHIEGNDNIVGDNNTVVKGDNNTVVGERGVYVGGNVSGSVITGDGKNDRA